MITGWEEFLGYLADRLGLDLHDKSRVRKVVIVTLYSVVGLTLLIGGGGYAFIHRKDSVAFLSGVLCFLVGATYLVRIIINIIKAREPSA